MQQIVAQVHHERSAYTDGYRCRRNGMRFRQSFERGVPIEELQQEQLGLEESERRGTQVQFLYDRGIFSKGCDRSSNPAYSYLVDATLLFL